MIEIALRAGHLVAVGMAVWLPAFCIALECHGEPTPTTTRAQRKLIAAAIIGLIVGGLTGVVYGAMLWEPGFQKALTAIGSRLAFAIVEFCFSLVLYGVYWVWLLRRKSSSRGGRGLQILVLLVAITNLAYHFPTLLGVVHRLTDFPLAGRLSSAEFRQVAFSPKVLADGVHFLIGSYVVATQVMLGLLRRDPVSDRFLRGAIVWAIVASCLQWPSGIAAFAYLPRAMQVTLVTLPGFIGLAIAMAIIWLLIVAQVGLYVRPRSSKWLWISGGLLGGILLVMSWIRCE